jgi:hypothetical protein
MRVNLLVFILGQNRSMQTHQSLIDDVQLNCDIADARHSGDMGMCAYLLKMREYFRWQQGYGLNDPMPREAIADWLTQREAQWQALDEMDYQPLSVSGRQYDPFDADAINAVINADGLVYSAGLVNCGRPHFFLCRLERRQETRDGYHLWLCGDELARGLWTPPGLSLGQNIFVGRQALRRYLWEQLEIWRWKRPQNAMGRVFGADEFETDLDTALDAMTDREMGTVLQHELGELAASEQLGQAWQSMLGDVLATPAEIAVRALRDLLADALRTLPYLIERGEPASIHFYIGSLTPMQKTLSPALLQAYEHWLADGDLDVFKRLAEQGVEHWLKLSQGMMTLHQQLADQAADAIHKQALQHPL